MNVNPFVTNASEIETLPSSRAQRGISVGEILRFAQDDGFPLTTVYSVEIEGEAPLIAVTEAFDA
jgi:hypothetical protein